MKMTTVKMLRGQSGLYPGWRGGTYHVRADGNPVEVPADLAAAWVAKGMAEEVRPKRFIRKDEAAPSGDSAAQTSSSESTTQEVNDD